MKNVNEYMLKTCIYMPADEYEELLKELFGEYLRVDFTLEGLGVEYNNITCDEPDIASKLAEYFDVKEITSIHIDDCDYMGVWIVYKDK